MFLSRRRWRSCPGLYPSRSRSASVHGESPRILRFRPFQGAGWHEISSLSSSRSVSFILRCLPGAAGFSAADRKGAPNYRRPRPCVSAAARAPLKVIAEGSCLGSPSSGGSFETRFRQSRCRHRRPSWRKIHNCRGTATLGQPRFSYRYCAIFALEAPRAPLSRAATRSEKIGRNGHFFCKFA
jgi:hypothetical protein